MSLVETEGLVLKSFGLAEADKIVVILTKERGLIRGVAKGAKRLKSRFGSSLEPFSIVRLTYFQKEERELVSIKSCEIIKSLFGTAGNLQLFRKFSYVVELLNDFAPPADPNERLYRMVKVWLETTSENPRQVDSMIFYFELWLLKLGGYLPSWEKCAVCRQDLENIPEFDLQANFHLVCGNCRRKSRNQTISALQREIFLIAQKTGPLSFLALTKDKTEDLREVSMILKRIIAGVLDKDIVDEKILMAKGF